MHPCFKKQSMKKKNSSVNKAKNQEKNFHLKKIYEIFEKKVKKHIGKKSFSVGVSGGADSMCLAFFTKLYQAKYKNKVFYFIVDHGLRSNSSKEANAVKKLLNKYNIYGTILKYKGIIPKSNIQSKARDIRYSIIYEKCKKNNVKYFITAHHLDDQIETFLMRLIRGSGLIGLSSMSEINTYKKINIIRPFLTVEKRDLLKVTNHIFKKHIKDPSNKNKKFFRTRIRLMVKLMAKEGLSFSKLSKTIDNLNESKKSIEFYTKNAETKYVKYFKKKCFLRKSIFKKEPKEIIFRSLSRILMNLGKKNYPPRSRKILNLIISLKNKKFSKSTLGNCLITKLPAYIVFEREKVKI